MAMEKVSGENIVSFVIGRASQFLCIKDERPYHFSAVYASAMHSFCLPFRMKQSGSSAESICTSGALDMYGIVQMLAGQMRQNVITTLDVAMPAPCLSGSKRALINEVKDAVEASYNNSVTRPKFSHLSASTCPLPIPLPVPLIFANMIGQHDELLKSSISGSSSRGSLEVHSISMSTRLRSSTAVLPFFGK
ncbi:hypothetical protein HAX54_024738 [Datura stramonium]|uniref:Uncharacterized protein n=1 Tax=Datura stramonium TaxID=4076 RepID=A0ABS8RK84_DATST|nr:hypothetical protein [Datura stramonium]